MPAPLAIPLLLMAGAAGLGAKAAGSRKQAKTDAAYTRAKFDSIIRMLEGYADDKDATSIMSLEPSAKKFGIDVDPYVKAAGNLTAEEKVKREFWNMISGSMGTGQPTQPVGEIPVTTTSTEMEELGIQPTAPAPAEAPATSGFEVTPHRLRRMMWKKLGGFDIGPPKDDPQANADWFTDFQTATKDPNQPVSQAIIDTAAKHGFIPDGASQLEGLSTTERDALFMREFHQKINDTQLLSQMEALVPGMDPKKAAMIHVLDQMAAQGGYVPEALQPFTETQRTLGVETTPEIKQVLSEWGIEPGSASPDAIRMAELEYERRQRTAASRAKESEMRTVERVEQDITFGETGGAAARGPIARDVAKKEAMQAVPRPLESGPAGRLGKSKGFFKKVDSITKLIADVTTAGGKLKKPNINLLPVGAISEPIAKMQDKYGIYADSTRIKLRQNIRQLVDVMYEIRGKQLSDREIALAQETMAALNESPIAFVTKYKEFSAYIRDKIIGELEGYEAANFDVTGIKKLLSDWIE